MAGIFERMAMIVRANVNDLLDQFEEPEKMVDQAIQDAIEEYGKVKSDALPVLANEIQTRNQLDALNGEAEKWHNVAVNALKANDEAGAKRALERENEFKAQAGAQEITYKAAKEAADKLRGKLMKMEIEINEMKNKAAQIKATAATAKATKSAAEISQRGRKYSGFDAFARMQEKADKELAKAEALESLEEGAPVDKEEEDLLKKYGSGSTTSVDESLEKLKKELGI